MDFNLKMCLMYRRDFLQKLAFLSSAVLLNIRHTIVCSIWPISLIIEEMVDSDKFTIKTVVPRWKDPHDYIITPREKLTFDNASLSFEIGAGLEKYAGTNTTILADHYPFLIGKHRIGNSVIANPHIWLDPIAVRDYIIPTILNVLADKYPLLINKYKIERLRQRLTDMNTRFSADLSVVQSVPFITEETALSYFVRRYHLNLAGSVKRDNRKIGINIRWLYRLSKIIKKQNVKLLFIHKSSSIEPFRVFVEDYGLRIYKLNSLGYGLKSYESMMNTLETTILKALKQFS